MCFRQNYSLLVFLALMYLFCGIQHAIRKSFRIFVLAIFSISILFSVEVIAQEDPDFLNLLNDSVSSGNFLQPKHSGRKFPFSGNELINRKRLEAATRNENFRGIATAAANLGWIQINKSNPAAAIPYFKKSLEANQQNKDNKGIGASYIELGIATQQIKDEFHAVEYFSAALPYIEKQKLNKVSGFCYAMIAQSYARQKDPIKSGEYYSRASKSFLAAGDKIQAAACLNLLGETQLRFNDYKKASGNLNAALELASKSSKDKKMQAVILRNLGLVYFKKGEFENAISYFNKSLAADEQLLVLKLVKDAYMQLFTMFSFRNDFVKADQFHDKYRELKDQLDKRDAGKKPALLTAAEAADKQSVIEMLQRQMEEQSLQMNQHQLELSQMITKADIELQTMNQEIEQKDQKVKELEEQKVKNERDLARQELRISRQNSFRNLLIAITIAVLLLTLLLYNRFKLKQKANIHLEHSNKEIAIAMDELKKAQDRLIQSEKMASLGQLTAGIAHEIQNPLNFVNNFSESSMMMLDDYIATKDETERDEIGQELKDNLTRIRHHGGRADKIVKHMLQHSRSGTSEKEISDINRICEETSELAYHGARASLSEFHCNVVKHFDDTLPPVMVNRQDLSRVLVNLLNNSFYAMHRKIKSDPSGNYQPELNIFTTQKENLVVITVRDNGTGIPKQVQEKIFNPFFTTKPTGEGTGLGLSMSYDILTKGHNGKLEMESEEGVFTEFRISIPITI
ncbi:hypothetical protein BH11BAC2_BH11BAC2_03850 [soil metagenome]